MAGTVSGGKRAAATNRKQFGDDFYKIIGSKGGQKKGVKKGFALNPDLARKAGAKGGRISKRGLAKKGQKKFIWEGGQDGQLVFTKEQPSGRQS